MSPDRSRRLRFASVMCAFSVVRLKVVVFVHAMPCGWYTVLVRPSRRSYSSGGGWNKSRCEASIVSRMKRLSCENTKRRESAPPTRACCEPGTAANASRGHVHSCLERPSRQEERGAGWRLPRPRRHARGSGGHVPEGVRGRLGNGEWDGTTRLAACCALPPSAAGY